MKVRGSRLPPQRVRGAPPPPMVQPYREAARATTWPVIWSCRVGECTAVVLNHSSANDMANASPRSGSDPCTCRPPWLALVDGIGSVVMSVGYGETHARRVGRRARRRG